MVQWIGGSITTRAGVSAVLTPVLFNAFAGAGTLSELYSLQVNVLVGLPFALIVVLPSLRGRNVWQHLASIVVAVSAWASSLQLSVHLHSILLAAEEVLGSLSAIALQLVSYSLAGVLGVVIVAFGLKIVKCFSRPLSRVRPAVFLGAVSGCLVGLGANETWWGVSSVDIHWMTFLGIGLWNLAVGVSLFSRNAVGSLATPAGSVDSYLSNREHR